MLRSALFHRQKVSSLLHRCQLFHATTMRAMANNALEESLEQAATDPNHRAQFYRDLMTSNIYVIPAPTPPEGASKSGGLYLQQWQIPIQGKPQSVLPFFSSLENVQEFQMDLSAADREPHAELKCRTFLELVANIPAGTINIVLNPGLPYGKAFSTTEIAGLLDGSLLAPEMSEIASTSSSNSEIIMGQPKEYPTALVEALKELFQDFDAVDAAYLAHVFVPESGEPPHTCIGLQVSNPEALQVVLQFAITAQKQVEPNKIVDFVHVTEDRKEEDELVQYLLKTEPFYRGI